jgi:hypothetical protein
MRIVEVRFLTEDVVRLADFYKAVPGVDNGNKDPDGNLVVFRRLPV